MSRGHLRPHGDGRWRLYAPAGSDPLTGKRRQVTKIVNGTRKQAEKALAALVADVDRHTVVPSGEQTFGQVLDAWLTHKSLSVEATTADVYRHQLAYIPERLADTPVTRIGVEHLEGLYAQLLRSGNKRTGGGLSAKSVRNVHIAVHGALELARRRRWIASNPAADAEVPTGPRRSPSPAPAGAIGALLAAAAAEHPHLPTYLRVSVCVGGRRSEVHGIRWSGVDFTRGRITLRDTVVYAAGAWQIKPRTKTGGQRILGIGPGTVEALRVLQAAALDWALECGTTLAADAFVFSDDAAGTVPWNPITTARRFQRACVAAGLPAGTRLHDLRHLMATHAIDQGAPIPAVSARLGHAQNSTTLDVYTGRLAQSDDAVVEVIERLFDGL